MNPLPHHPIQTLLFCVEDEISDEVCVDIEDTIAKYAEARDWLLGPPTFVNEHDDEGVLTLGGFLRMYSGLPPNKLPLEIDKRLYEDASQFIHLARELSIANGLTFHFELDGDHVGCVSGGDMDFWGRHGHEFGGRGFLANGNACSMRSHKSARSAVCAALEAARERYFANGDGPVRDAAAGVYSWLEEKLATPLEAVSNFFDPKPSSYPSSKPH